MKRILPIFLIVIVLASLFTSCSKPNAPLDSESPQSLAPMTAAEYLSLGEKYLLELNYEQAIVCFTRVIEIEPLNVRAYAGRGDAYILFNEQLDLAKADYEKAIEIDTMFADGYLGLVDVYIRMGDMDTALEIAKDGYAKTNDEVLKTKISELESGNISDSQGQSRRTSTYDGNGNLQYYWDYTYGTDGRRTSVTSYSGGGSQTGHVAYQYDDQGNQRIDSYCGGDTGAACPIECFFNQNGEITKEIWYRGDEIDSTIVFSYNAIGYLYEKQWYDGSGNLTLRDTYEYDTAGRETRQNRYDGGGSLMEYEITEYNENGIWERANLYDADGTLTGYRLYQYKDEEYAGWDYYDAEGALVRSRVYE